MSVWAIEVLKLVTSYTQINPAIYTQSLHSKVYTPKMLQISQI